MDTPPITATTVELPRTAAPEKAQQAGFAIGFIWAALSIALTMGFAIAAHLAFVIGFDFPLGQGFASFIQVHGHAQLLGWTGLFIISISLHFIPRLIGTPIDQPRLVHWVLGLLVSGLIVRGLAQSAVPYLQNSPFFGMGEKGQFVNLWMWKSERQADLEPAFQDIDKVYPNIGIDSYPNLMRSALEQPTRHALTLESNPDFITGWGAGNIVSDPTRKSPSEDLSAQGFGTLKAHPMPDQNVAAKGVYDVGTYRVVLRRSFNGSGKYSVDLNPGQIVPVAFAVWNGSAGDRDGKKSVTIWQELVIVE